MKKGMKVTWKTVDNNIGFGTVISDEEDGHVLVAVLTDGEKHHVIWCTVTWLTQV